MNIKELIEKLKQFDPETLVVVNGYEEGQDDINNIEEITIALNPNKQSNWYEGKYCNESCFIPIGDYDVDYPKPKNVIKAIILDRHEPFELKE
jgi:hypothetical protein